MKTAEIKDLLKKELLIIELPENTKSWEFLDGKFWVDDKQVFVKGFTPFHTLLGKPDEISEEDAMELVQKIFIGFKNYKSKEIEFFMHATESLLSAIESVIFWDVNPYQDVKGSVIDMTLGQWMDKKKFLEAQEKTFDRSRSLIFKKKI